MSHASDQKPPADSAAVQPDLSGPVVACFAQTENAMSLCRVITLVDLDCFYAQVKAVAHPELKGEPIGVTQKHTMVTCNYVARRMGVSKMMNAVEAVKFCPSLRLFNGEDLEEFRIASEAIFAVMSEFTPLVERQGLDECFLDLTAAVDARIASLQETAQQSPTLPLELDYHGAVLGLDSPLQSIPLHSSSSPTPPGSVTLRGRQWVIGAPSTLSLDSAPMVTHTALYSSDAVRLCVGSHIADEIRAAVLSRLGFTCSAGIGVNRALSKLACGVRKPNEQTVFLPAAADSSQSLALSPRSLQGIGHSLAAALASAGINTVESLRQSSRLALIDLLGPRSGNMAFDLARGVDPSPVERSRGINSATAEDAMGLTDSWPRVYAVLEVLCYDIAYRVRTEMAQTDRRPTKLVVRYIREPDPPAAPDPRYRKSSSQAPFPAEVMAVLSCCLRGSQSSDPHAPRSHCPNCHCDCSCLHTADWFVGPAPGLLSPVQITSAPEPTAHPGSTHSAAASSTQPLPSSPSPPLPHLPSSLSSSFSSTSSSPNATPTAARAEVVRETLAVKGRPLRERDPRLHKAAVLMARTAFSLMARTVWTGLPERIRTDARISGASAVPSAGAIGSSPPALLDITEASMMAALLRVPARTRLVNVSAAQFKDPQPLASVGPSLLPFLVPADRGRFRSHEESDPQEESGPPPRPFKRAGQQSIDITSDDDEANDNTKADNRSSSKRLNSRSQDKGPAQSVSDEIDADLTAIDEDIDRFFSVSKQ